MEYTQEMLEKMADECLAQTEEGREILRQGEDLKFFGVAKEGYEIKSINFTSENGEGFLDYLQNGEEIYISSISAFPTGSGIGSYLFEKLSEVAGKKRIRNIEARITVDNIDAKRFFHSKGFCEREIDYNVFPPEIIIEKRLRE